MRHNKSFALPVGVILAILALGACAPEPTSNDIQRERSNDLLKEGVAQVGLPAIPNFREFKTLKMIYELRDQEGLVTYTYAENMVPTPIPGYTTLGGKFTFFCDSIGYPISASAQFTAGETMQRYVIPRSGAAEKVSGVERLPQAEPNGLFMPASAEGSWALCKEPGKDKVGVVYSEPRLVAFPWKLPVDGR